MPKCYQLVGVPGSGKTTWVESQIWAKDCAYISTDVFVERFARRMAKSYSEVFNDVMPRCIRLMMRAVRKAQLQRRDIIWDQTSTSIISRIKKFNALPDYDHIAVVFPTPEKSELERRLASRSGKTISIQIVEQMAFDLEMEPPTQDEGFAEIWYT
jgi:predicted kinase